MELSPQAEAEISGLCDDEVDVGDDGPPTYFFRLATVLFTRSPVVWTIWSRDW